MGRSSFFWMIGLEARAHDDVLVALAHDLEWLDVGIHVGHGHHPIQVVVLVDVGIGCQPELGSPALQEAAPEEVAIGHTIAFLMAQRLVEPVQLGRGMMMFFPLLRSLLQVN